MLCSFCLWHLSHARVSCYTLSNHPITPISHFVFLCRFSLCHLLSSLSLPSRFEFSHRCPSLLSYSLSPVHFPPLALCFYLFFSPLPPIFHFDHCLLYLSSVLCVSCTLRSFTSVFRIWFSMFTLVLVSYFTLSCLLLHSLPLISRFTI